MDFRGGVADATDLGNLPNDVTRRCSYTTV